MTQQAIVVFPKIRLIIAPYDARMKSLSKKLWLMLGLISYAQSCQAQGMGSPDSVCAQTKELFKITQNATEVFRLLLAQLNQNTDFFFSQLQLNGLSHSRELNAAQALAHGAREFLFKFPSPLAARFFGLQSRAFCDAVANKYLAAQDKGPIYLVSCRSLGLPTQSNSACFPIHCEDASSPSLDDLRNNFKLILPFFQNCNELTEQQRGALIPLQTTHFLSSFAADRQLAFANFGTTVLETAHLLGANSSAIDETLKTRGCDLIETRPVINDRHVHLNRRCYTILPEHYLLGLAGQIVAETTETPSSSTFYLLPLAMILAALSFLVFKPKKIKQTRIPVGAIKRAPVVVTSAKAKTKTKTTTPVPVPAPVPAPVLAPVPVPAQQLKRRKKPAARPKKSSSPHFFPAEKIKSAAEIDFENLHEHVFEFLDNYYVRFTRLFADLRSVENFDAWNLNLAKLILSQQTKNPEMATELSTYYFIPSDFSPEIYQQLRELSDNFDEECIIKGSSLWNYQQSSDIDIEVNYDDKPKPEAEFRQILNDYFPKAAIKYYFVKTLNLHAYEITLQNGRRIDLSYGPSDRSKSLSLFTSAEGQMVLNSQPRITRSLAYANLLTKNELQFSSEAAKTQLAGCVDTLKSNTDKFALERVAYALNHLAKAEGRSLTIDAEIIDIISGLSDRCAEADNALNDLISRRYNRNSGRIFEFMTDLEILYPKASAACRY